MHTARRDYLARGRLSPSALASKPRLRELQHPGKPDRQNPGAAGTRARLASAPSLLTDLELVEDQPVAGLELGDVGVHLSLLSGRVVIVL